MKRVNYAQKELGDILLVADDDLLSKGIIAAEHELAPGLDWYPSHSGIVCVNGLIIEARCNLHQNSAAATNPISQYDGVVSEVWRPEGDLVSISRAVNRTIDDLEGRLYGALDLVGFLIEAAGRALGDADFPNLIRVGYICSETCLYYLRNLNSLSTAIALGPLSWTRTDESIRNVAPAVLRQLFLRHEEKA